jgi:putative PIN family toxin of toxin-antitoxin system
VRAVFDPNVVVSAAISPTGTPAELIRRWRVGEFELVVSDELLDELDRVLQYPKLRQYVDANEAGALIAALRTDGIQHNQPADPPPVRSSDPNDDYLIALATVSGAALVSGDRHLLDLPGELPIYSPADFSNRLDEEGSARPH